MASTSSSPASTSSLKGTLIVAHDSSRGIGVNGSLPWRLPKEMKYFAAATTTAPEGKQNAVIMGRTTWEGIPSKFRPLKERINVVLSSRTREELQLPDIVLQASSLRQGFEALQAKRDSLHRIYIIGGAQLYKSCLQDPEDQDFADRILLTRITKGDEKWECDTFFPELDEQQWRKASHAEHQEWLQGIDVPESEVEEKEVTYRYEMWTRK